MIPTRLFILFLLISSVSQAQIQFWSDNFEDPGLPSSGIRTFTYEGGSGGPPNTRYFKRTDAAGINVSPVYSNVQGAKFWAAEDVDGAPSGIANQQSPEQNVTWTTINITGMSILSFRGFFATTLATVWDHGTSTTIADYCVVQARIDGGAWTPILSFRPNMLNQPTGALAADLNNDGLGDGTPLSSAFTEFIAPITGTGTTLELRCMVSTNALAEELAFDNFRLFYGSALPVTFINFSGSHVNGRNELVWSTASEQNSSHFEVERSEDGNSFHKIGHVNAAGTSVSERQYTYLDNYLQAAKIYYRLKQVDMDGSAAYSKTITIDPAESKNAIRFFPNPVAEKLVIDPGNLKVSASSFQIVNSTGAIMPALFVNRNRYYECNTTGLPAGIYFVRFVAEGQTRSRIFVKK